MPLLETLVPQALTVCTYTRFVAESEPRLAVVDVHTMEQPETLHFAVRRNDPNLLEHPNAFIRKQLEA